MGTASALQIDFLPSGALTMIAPRGELDMAAAPELSAAVDRALDGDPLMIVLVHPGLTFIDTTGITAVIAAGRTCKAQRRQFFLIRGAPHIDRVLRAAGLEGPFEVVSDLDHLDSPR